MKNIKNTILCTLLSALAFFSAYAEECVLYWQILDNATVDGVALDDFSSSYVQTHYNLDVGGNSGKIAGARTVMYNGDSSTPIAMNLAEYDGHQWTITEWTDTFIVADDLETVIGTGGGIYSHFVLTDPTETYFAIELGNWENGQWLTLASSDQVDYNSLTIASQDGTHIFVMVDNMNLNNYQPWAPTTYSIPEPNSLVLTLIGASFLILKRKYT